MGAPESGDTERLSAVLEAVDEWPVPRAAVAAVAHGGSVTRGDTAHRFAWASVTKMLTALAVLVAVEEGTVALDEPAGPDGSTVRHLLSHASGFGPDDPAVRTPFGQAENAGGARPVATPATRRIYSNRGFEVLATVVAERTGMAFQEYLIEGVLEPLGMDGASLNGSPAWGATGTLGDLVLLGSELLHPRLIARETLDEATRVAFPGLAGVLPGFGRFDPNDWGLGFEIRGAKHPHWTGSLNSSGTFGHFGQSGAFLWVDPNAGVACCGLADKPFGPWAKEAWPRLADAVLATVLPG